MTIDYSSTAWRIIRYHWSIVLQSYDYDILYIVEQTLFAHYFIFVIISLIIKSL